MAPKGATGRSKRSPPFESWALLNTSSSQRCSGNPPVMSSGSTRETSCAPGRGHPRSLRQVTGCGFAIHQCPLGLRNQAEGQERQKQQQRGVTPGRLEGQQAPHVLAQAFASRRVGRMFPGLGWEIALPTCNPTPPPNGLFISLIATAAFPQPPFRKCFLVCSGCEDLAHLERRGSLPPSKQGLLPRHWVGFL